MGDFCVVENNRFAGVTKTCVKCEAVSDRFTFNARSSDGISHTCHDCNSKSHRAAVLGSKRTEPQRRKISESKKGRSSDAIRQAGKDASKRRRGITLSQDHRRAISESGKGRIFSSLHKLNLSRAARKRYGSENLNDDELKLKRWGSKYGLSLDQLSSMIDRYDGKCWLCREKDAGHIDHCHFSNRVRGLLCVSCNTALGKLGDSEEGVLKALRYIREETP